MTAPLIHLVDDDAAVRRGLALLIGSVGLSVAEWPHPQAFLDAFDRQAVGAIVLDVRMPGTSGLVLFERLAERQWLDLLPVIFLTGHGDVPSAVAAVKRGAFDFVEKPFSNNALVDRIEQALAASAATLQARRDQARVAALLAELTERERDVMHRVIDGRPNKLIADELGISVRTVEVHRARVFEKMDVKSAVELANLLRH